MSEPDVNEPDVREPDVREPDVREPDVRELDPEDAKLITLARATRARTGAADGAAVRDTDGRTYAAATVDLPSLSLTALQVAVAMAASSGVIGLEAAAVVGDADSDGPGAAAVRDLGGPAVPVLLAGPDGRLRSRSAP